MIYPSYFNKMKGLPRSNSKFFQLFAASSAPVFESLSAKISVSWRGCLFPYSKFCRRAGKRRTFSDVYVKKTVYQWTCVETAILLKMSKAAYRMSGFPVGSRKKAIKNSIWFCAIKKSQAVKILANSNFSEDFACLEFINKIAYNRN